MVKLELTVYDQPKMELYQISAKHVAVNQLNGTTFVQASVSLEIFDPIEMVPITIDNFKKILEERGAEISQIEQEDWIGFSIPNSIYLSFS